MTSNGWVNVGDVQLPDGFLDDIPTPVTWRLLVMPQAPETVSSGGIVLTTSNQEAQQYNTYVGQVVKAGPLVGRREPMNAEPFDVAVGDWVVYGRYAGQRVEVKGIKLLFLNDEDVLGTTTNPKALTVKV
jgi:chaperonin GroES